MCIWVAPTTGQSFNNSNVSLESTTNSKKWQSRRREERRERGEKGTRSQMSLMMSPKENQALSSHKQILKESRAPLSTPAEAAAEASK